jgi:hypothetical protein
VLFATAILIQHTIAVQKTSQQPYGKAIIQISRCYCSLLQYKFIAAIYLFYYYGVRYTTAAVYY